MPSRAPWFTGGLLIAAGLGLLAAPIDAWLPLEEGGGHVVDWSRRVVRVCLLGCLAAGVLLAAFRRRPRVVAVSRGLPVALLAVVIVLAAWELAFPVVVRRLPLAVWGHLPRPVDVLAQSSKARAVPADYVVLLGDSNAQGHGDWLLGTSPWTNGPYHSAHVLRELLGRDVITLARGGAGSMRGLVLHPLEGLRRLRHQFPVDAPRLAIAYFYEGNDAVNNLNELRLYGYARRETDGPVARARLFEVLDRNLAPSPDEAINARLPGLKLGLLMTGYVLSRRPARAPEGAPTEAAPPRPFVARNRAQVGGREIALPDSLQAPPLELTAQDVGRAVTVFEFSLEYVRRKWPRTPFVVAYLPSPLGTYGLVGGAAVVASSSDDLAARVAAASRRGGAAFIDTRPSLRQQARVALLHGPRDWKHLNRLGYTTLAHAIADGLRELPELAHLVPPVPKEAGR